MLKSILKSNSIECKNNPKAFWNYVRTKTVHRASIGTLKYNDIIAENELDKANMLNSYCAQVFTNEELTILPTVEELPDISLITEIIITPEAVLQKLDGLNVNKSTGPDGLHPRILKELAPVIAVPICNIMNKCFEQGRIPEDWKQANVTCIFKKGNKSDPGNYRPISLTNILCKITESFVKDAIYKHLQSNNILTNCQHGFRCKMSCITQLLEVTEFLTKRYDEGLSTDVIYLDFQKAFDKVPHTRLLLKLHSYGIRGPILAFIYHYLTNRKQRVLINSSYSMWVNVLSGIPQGSILGPLLFTIFINDLPDNMTNLCKMFADDTKIIAAPGISLQNDVQAAAAWAEKWQMMFNAKKCKTLHFGHNNHKQQYYITNETIENPAFEKDLGIYFENGQNFDTHINVTVNKGNRLVGLIRKSFSYMINDMFLNLYCTLVRPILEYGGVIWSPHLKKHINKLEAVQRRATKLIPAMKYLSYKQRLTNLNLFSLAYRRRRGDLIQVYRIINSLDNLNVDDFFKLQTSSRTRGHGNKIIKLRLNTSVRQHYFSQRVINDWNNLPTSAVLAKSITVFKKEIDNHLHECIYDF